MNVYDVNYENLAMENENDECSHGIFKICIFPYGNTNQSPQQFHSTKTIKKTISSVFHSYVETQSQHS